MGLGETFKQVVLQAKANFDASFERARFVFEPQLTPIGLGKSQIESQTVEELEQSLERVNDALKNPEAFGTLKLKADETGNLVIAKSGSDSLFEIGALPILLERKKLILERLGFLRREEKIENLQDLVKKVSDESLRPKLESELKSLETEAQKLREQSIQVEQAQLQIQEQMKIDTELARLKEELFEKRSKVWRSFLERESVATVIGSLLLVLLVITQIVAMFLQVQTTEVVNNGFLLILGYFFGQTVSRASSPKD